MPDGQPSRGLLDTSVLVDLAALAGRTDSPLPDRADISSVSLAELSAGPLLTRDEHERALRQQVVQRVQAEFDALPFDDRCAAAYARVVAATRAAGRSHRSRVADLLIAATAVAHQLPLYTRNPGDFVPLEALLHVEAV